MVGIYFSANWYPPCRSFNEVLSNCYEELRCGGSDFEVVFVSADEDIEAFDRYRLEMPWLSIPFSDLESKKALTRKFDVEGIPCLVILQPNDTKDEQTLSNGVELVYRYGVGAFPFTKGRLDELEKEEEEKRERQNLSTLLIHKDRDFLLSNSTPCKVSMFVLPSLYLRRNIYRHNSIVTE